MLCNKPTICLCILHMSSWTSLHSISLDMVEAICNLWEFSFFLVELNATVVYIPLIYDHWVLLMLAALILGGTSCWNLDAFCIYFQNVCMDIFKLWWIFRIILMRPSSNTWWSHMTWNIFSMWQFFIWNWKTYYA